MWILSYKRYGASKMATFVSVIGTLTRYGGVLCLFTGLFPAAIICVGIGIGMHFWAESIAFGAWKKLAKKNGVENALRQGNEEVARALIPGLDKKYAQYVLSLMPAPSEELRKMVNGE